uniref:Uncharacterized protein n=1 Tax=Oryza nivara TaxID=4536 RepID=A0A0E0GZN6_ORYNI
MDDDAAASAGNRGGPDRGRQRRRGRRRRRGAGALGSGEAEEECGGERLRDGMGGGKVWDPLLARPFWLAKFGQREQYFGQLDGLAIRLTRNPYVLGGCSRDKGMPNL